MVHVAEVPLVKVDLPAYTDGCEDDAKAVACDYPETQLQKVVSTTFADSGSPAVDLVKNFQWTNDDQNLVAKYIADQGMSPEDAAAEVGRREPRQGRRLALLTAPAHAPQCPDPRSGIDTLPGSGRF